MQLKVLFYQNGCYLPLDLLKDWSSNLNIATKVFLPWVYSSRTKTKHLTDGCSRIFTLHYSQKYCTFDDITKNLFNMSSFNYISY